MYAVRLSLFVCVCAFVCRCGIFARAKVIPVWCKVRFNNSKLGIHWKWILHWNLLPISFWLRVFCFICYVVAAAISCCCSSLFFSFQKQRSAEKSNSNEIIFIRCLSLQISICMMYECFCVFLYAYIPFSLCFGLLGFAAAPSYPFAILLARCFHLFVCIFFLLLIFQYTFLFLFARVHG